MIRAGMSLSFRRLSLLLRRPSVGFETSYRRSGGLLGRIAVRSVDAAQVGFFVGFITDAGPWKHLAPIPPEAVVFAFVKPVTSRLHERLVRGNRSLFAKAALIARDRGVPFEFHEDQHPALARHRSLRGMPPEILALTAHDFFATSMRGLWAADFFDRVRRVRRTRSRSRR